MTDKEASPYLVIPNPIKLNLGCGHDYREGYINVDKYSTSKADQILDLESLPWPWETNSAQEVVLRHILEHIGQSTELYKQIIQELYRVCAPNAIVHIEVPHPFHPDYIGDPTHCRPITAQGLWLFNLDDNRYIIKQEWPSSTLAMYWDVDFNMLENIEYMDQDTHILKWSKMTLQARKKVKMCLNTQGIGDICMCLSAAHALHDAGYRVSMVAQESFYPLILACPYIDHVTADREGERYLTSAWYHFQAAHEVDTYCRACGIPADSNPESKSLVINVPKEITEEMRQKYPGKNRIVIHPAGRVPSRHWPDSYWQELASRLLAEGIQVVATGMSDWLGDATLRLDGVLNEFDLSPFHTIALMNQCSLFIAPDSGPIQLAGATDCGILGLYSVILPEHRLPYRHGRMGWNAKGLVTSCPHAGCYNEMTTGEEEDFVWAPAASQRLWDGESMGHMIHTWCLNEAEPYSCMSLITVDQVFAEAMKMYGSFGEPVI